MEWFIRYSFLFFTGGFFGWVLELFFRRFVSQKKWVNPGFLTGPFLPLYGFGLVGFYFFGNEIPWSEFTSSGLANDLIEILCLGVLMTLIEYIAGLIFIKGIKVKLWDYSKRWGNIQGIICPLFSAIWTLVGALYIFFLNPFFQSETAFVIANELFFALLGGFFYGVMFIDFGWSIGLTTKIRKAVADRKLVVDWDQIKVSFQEHYQKLHRTPQWVLPFKTKAEEFSDMMNEYLAALRSDLSARQKERQIRLDTLLRKRDEKARLRTEKAKHRDDKDSSDSKGK
jgi:uncharacterized membrane protein